MVVYMRMNRCEDDNTIFVKESPNNHIFAVIEATIMMERYLNSVNEAREAEESQEEAGRGEGDRQPEHDLDQLAKAAAGVAEGQREARGDDDDHRDDPRHRPLDGFEHRLQRRLPGHVRAGRVRGQRDDQQQRRCGGDVQKRFYGNA